MRIMIAGGCLVFVIGLVLVSLVYPGAPRGESKVATANGHVAGTAYGNSESGCAYGRYYGTTHKVSGQTWIVTGSILGGTLEDQIKNGTVLRTK